MTKKILLFGANGYIAQTFQDAYREKYEFICVTRKHLDMSDIASVEKFRVRDILPSYMSTTTLHGIVFLQGINPRVGAYQIQASEFEEMIRVNLVAPTILLKNNYELMYADSSVVFLSSIAVKKGSYDPSYAAAKAGLIGLVPSLANAYPSLRFNTLSLGLVENSPVHEGMTNGFDQKHKDKMGGKLVDPSDVADAIDMLINNKSINRANIDINCGYKE